MLAALLCLVTDAVALPAFEVVKYSTLGTKQANADAVIMGDPTREDITAVVKELVAHYRSRGFADVYVGCYRHTEVGRHMAVDEFYEAPLAQAKVNWLCLYSRIGASETIMFKPWEWDDFGDDVSWYGSAKPTVKLGGTKQKPKYPSGAAPAPVPEVTPPNPDEEFLQHWAREAVRLWPGVSSLASSKGCTLVVFNTYLTGKGAKALARGLAADYLLREYGIWAEAAILVAELGSPISEIAASANDISHGICVEVVESSGQRHRHRLQAREFLSPPPN
jgi:hypothetical protein